MFVSIKTSCFILLHLLKRVLRMYYTFAGLLEGLVKAYIKKDTIKFHIVVMSKFKYQT